MTSEAPHAAKLLAPGSHARRWTVTFTGQPFDLPSMLVSTQAGATAADLHACAGTLGGSSPVVSVATVTHGGLPLELVTDGAHSLAAAIADASNPGFFYVRVSAFNGVGWSAPRVAPLAVVPATQPPMPPRDVVSSRVSPTKVAVSWSPPERDGGAGVSKYSVQWATDTSFDGDAGLNLVDASEADPDTGRLSFVIQGLEEGTPYFVRVLSYNRAGYSEGASALPLGTNLEVQAVVVVEDSAAGVAAMLAMDDFDVAAANFTLTHR